MAQTVNSTQKNASNDSIKMDTAVELSEIHRFYKNSTVLVTGATGFVGKLVLEKILRLCHVKHVYVLARGKDGKDAESRCAEIFDSLVFDSLRRTDPEFFKRVSLLLGDLEKPDLGLVDYDKNLIIKEVNCIFHCGAATGLEEPLKKSVFVNVRATRDLLEIAKQAEDLKSFVFLSTAFSNFPKFEVHEEVYEPSVNAEKFISTVETLDDYIIGYLEPKLLAEWPSAFTFTKNVAEEYVKRNGKDFPISIVRPSHIVPAVREPMAGYVENIFSLSGLAAANALGVNRVDYYKNVTLDVIPVDYVVSLLLASGWYAGLQKLRKKRGDIVSTDVIVYNCTSSQEKPLTTEEWMKVTETVCNEVPTSKMIRSPLTFSTSCYYNYRLLTFIFHTFMAFLCDSGLKLAGREPKIVEGYRKFHKFQELGSRFLMKQWYFSNENVQRLLKRMSYDDRELFNFDVLTINWESYFASFARGVRVYILKDPMSTLAEGKKVQQRKLVSLFLSTVFAIVVLYVVVKFTVFKVFVR